MLNVEFAADFSEEAKAAAPTVEKLLSPTTEQADKANKFLADNWNKTIS